MRVSIYAQSDRLKVRFGYQGTRYHFALNLDDDSLGRLKARELASLIERDCLFDNFDSSCNRYRFDPKPAVKPGKKAYPAQYPFNPKRMPFKRVEASNLLTALSESHYHGFISFLLLTGLRPSEAIGLTFNRVGDSSITIDRVLARAQGSGNSSSRVWKTPKNGRKREILLSDKMKAVIERSSGSGNDLIFTTPNGLPINDQNVLKRVFKPTQETLGITPVRVLYACRHSWATWALEGGMSINHVAHWLGHRSIEITIRNYIHGSLPADFQDVI